jgi:hypothetical protein
MTDAERLWRWVGRHLLAAAMYCFRQSGASFSVTHHSPEEKA